MPVTFHEFGNLHGKIIVLLPPACATHELWLDYIERLQEHYRIIAPDYTGHGKGELYTSVEDNAYQISSYLNQLENEIFLIWGVSEGATMALKILAMNELSIRYTIADAPFVFERLRLRDKFAALKISLAVALLPFLSRKRKAALVEEQKRELGEHKGQRYCDSLFKLQARSLFREFYSCFTFTLPEDTSHVQTRLGLWYGEKETEKYGNIQYLLSRFPKASAKMFNGYAHVEYWMKDMEGYLSDVMSFVSEAEE